ncbi:hypothetical protein [Streptomyces sp. NPDC059009]|uniref:hypothetical protein n=1 Tax=Streptomyces sp. NPDC059009 TaxID=3346694 RepID=UPI0036C3FD32
MCFDLELQNPPGGIVGMRISDDVAAAARREMAKLGMLTPDVPPDEPAPEDYGTTSVRIDSYLDSGGTEVPPDLEPFVDALHDLFDSQGENPTGIPCYKLITRDGWLVTPDEITAALGCWTAASQEHRDGVRSSLTWWSEWISFLQRASEHGGFRVW